MLEYVGTWVEIHLRTHLYIMHIKVIITMLSCSNLVLCTVQAALFPPPIQVGKKTKGRLRGVDVYGPKTKDK